MKSMKVKPSSKVKDLLRGQSVLITGGTGSFGKKLLRVLLTEHPDLSRAIVYSRDELKQFEMAQDPVFQDPRVRFFIGDVRDRDRLRRALEDVDIVIHAAALKQVPAAEYNPFEVIQTNVLGAQNVIEGAFDQNVSRVIALSTDKAAAPINLYGATKLCSDKLFVAANHFRGKRDIRLSVVRYGNVVGSRGSVIPFFLDKRQSGVLPITDESMTRFSITLGEGVDLVMFALEQMWGGEIFVPRIPSYRILDLAQAIGPQCRHENVGIRPGEKLHEEMITASDSIHTIDCGDYFVITPSRRLWDTDEYVKAVSGQRCPTGFSYQSGTNTEWLEVEELRDIVRDHVDPNFSAE